MSFLISIIRISIPFAIVGAGLAVRSFLIQSKPEAETVPLVERGLLVETINAQVSQQALRVEAEGTVVPAQEVTIQTEVSGRIRSGSPHLVPGSRFKKGDSLLKISANEYQLRAAQSASEVEQARQQLALEKSRGEIAKQEWALIGDENASSAGRDTALRVPYQKEAQARLKAAQQQTKLARLNLERTEVSAPFNGFVKTGQVDIGQLVSPGAPLVTLVGSDSFLVQVSISVESLSDIMVPGFNAPDGEGSAASIWQSVGDETVERKGSVVRLLGDLDPVGRLARVLVEIDDPLGLKMPAKERGIPLLLGSFVHVKLDARSIKNVIELPRKAIHAGRYVHVFDADGLLDIRDVQIAWKTPDHFLISSGLEAGESVVLSRLGNAVSGMQLRRLQPDKLAQAQELRKVVLPEVDNELKNPEVQP